MWQALASWIAVDSVIANDECSDMEPSNKNEGRRMGIKWLSRWTEASVTWYCTNHWSYSHLKASVGEKF